MKDNIENNEVLEKIELQTALYLIKNNILFLSTNDILEKCDSKEKYTDFLNILFLIFENEPEFFIFATEEVNKILDVISNERGKYHDNEINELENDVILNFNILRNEPKRDLLKNEYIKNQEESRLCYFETEKQLKTSIGYDAVVITALENNDLENIKDVYFIMSTSYLLDDFPLLYKTNKNYIDMSLDKLKSIRESIDMNRKIKRKIKIIEKQLKNVAKKS